MLFFSAWDKWPNVPDFSSQNRLGSKNYWTEVEYLGIIFHEKDSPSIGTGGLSLKVVEV
jgi:hypothetical protein